MTLSQVSIETFSDTISEQTLVAFGSISTVKTFDPFPLNWEYLSNNKVLCPSPPKLSLILKHPVSTIIIGSGRVSR